MAGFLEDSKGNKSSKRLVGSIMVGLATIFSIILFICSIKQQIGDSRTAADIINMFLMFGSGLLGIGVLENMKLPGGTKSE